MAIFEQTYHNKSLVDDTEKLICNIENAQNVDKHTEYILRVQRGPSKDKKWCISRRYRDFAALHATLLQANIDLPMPPKKLLGNMQPSFIAERQIALQNYINEVLKHSILELSLPVRCFLDPNNYSLLLAEQALQTVSIALRGDGRFELKEPLPGIGWRIHKHYFLVKDIESGTDCILSWQNYGPDRQIDDKDLQTIFKSLRNLSHPHINQILAIHNLETGTYVVRKIHENGSLRDMLYDTDFRKNYLTKYGNPKVRKPLTLGQIAYYGHLILQTLKFLHDKGLPHGHIHPGNIAIENHSAMLLDIENILMGVPSLYRPHFLELRHVNSEFLDVYSFGRTLFEMAFGTPLESVCCDYFPYDTPTDLENVLRMCLSTTVCKYGSTTLKMLISYPLFNPTSPNGHLQTKVHFKLAAASKVQEAIAAAEARLKNDQKMVRSVRREVRIKEILSSEEEMKKQKRKKKREGLYKSSSSLAETVRSQSVSTGSSPTPPVLATETSVATLAQASPSPPAEPRSALLSAICSFDKNRLAKVNSSFHGLLVWVVNVLMSVCISHGLSSKWSLTKCENVLRMCLSTTVCKYGSTTLKMLISYPLFNPTSPNGHLQTKVHFKLAAASKVQEAIAAAEARLKNDQKMVRSVRREVRIKEILSSEEEMKKQKRKKKREGLYKSSSSLAETVRSQSVSTGSSPTPPVLATETSVATLAQASPSPPAEPRSALLSAICSFDKNRLAKVNSR